MDSYKVLIDTHLGCASNLINCSILYRYLIGNGHEITYKASNADYIIIGSCGVTKDVQEKYVQIFNRYYSLKKKNATIIIYGCLVKINNDLIKNLEAHLIPFENKTEFDKIFYKTIKIEDVKPNCDEDTKTNLVDAKKRFLLNLNPKHKFTHTVWENMHFFLSWPFIKTIKRVQENYKKIYNETERKNKVFVEICQGCTGNCSYCVIKKAKGKVKSRKIEDIILDAEKLYKPGKTLFLVADDCASYGVDSGSSLIELIYEIDKKFPGVSIDINYLSPNYLLKYSDEYVKLFKDVNINMVEIPLQSGSDNVTRNMNRRYEVKKVIEIIKEIREVSPETMLLAQFIVGFPGETRKDFLKTLSVLKYFDYQFPFKYSDMKEADSSKLPNKKSKYVVSLRWYIFMFFINFTILYTLLTFHKKSKKKNK